MKDIYQIQDTLDALYDVMGELTEDVNALILENERLKEKTKKPRKRSYEEFLYSEYFREYYGKER